METGFEPRSSDSVLRVPMCSVCHAHWVTATTVMSLMTQFMKERKVVLPTITYDRTNCLKSLVSLNKLCPCLSLTSQKLAL